eukprot:3908413-Pleurochrysis_carterae.AAC.1
MNTYRALFVPTDMCTPRPITGPRSARRRRESAASARPEHAASRRTQLDTQHFWATTSVQTLWHLPQPALK